MSETPESDLTLHYAPRTRSFTALWLVEELERPYHLESFAMASGRHRQDDFRALNPMGKVPVVVHRGTPVAELGAIAIYLADSFPEAGLGPRIDEPDRAAFLRWVFFASAIMEPAFGEKFFKWEVPDRSVAWGSFDRMWAALERALDEGPHLLGARFSAADVLVAASLRFGQMFGILPQEGLAADYVGRLSARPACQRAAEIERREGARFPMPQS